METRPYFHSADRENGSQELISVLVVTWNRREELGRCLQSVRGQTYKNIEVVVVDNASTDGTSAMITTDFPEVRLVRSARNLGCPSGRNLGFAFCEGEYIYMLDDDGWLKQDALEIAARQMRDNPRIGVVMSRIHEVENGCTVRQRPHGIEQPCYQASFSGGCSLIRNRVIQMVGMFPENFFRQGEEHDLALRMLEAGYYCFAEPRSIMFHAPSASGRNNLAIAFYNLRNSNRTGIRLWPFPWCVLRPIVSLGHAIRLSIQLGCIELPWRVLQAFVRDLFGLLDERKPVSVGTFATFRRLQKLGAAS